MKLKTSHLRCSVGLVLLSLLAACGGGADAQGAADAHAAPAQALDKPMALAQTSGTATAGFNLSVASFRTVLIAQSTVLVPDAQRFANPARTYVTLWYADSAGVRHELAFLTLAALQALDARGGLSLDVPVNVTTVSYEIYDKRGAATALSGKLRA